MKKEFDIVPTKIPFGSDAFRTYFRTVLVKDYPNGNYYLTTYVVALMIIIFTLSSLLDIHKPMELIGIPFYFLFCNLFEYLFHRFPMHHKMPGLSAVYHHLTIHHNFYANDLYYYETSQDYYAVIIPYYVWMHILASSSFISLLIYLSLSLNQAILFSVTVASYYLMYEILHFSYHAPRNSWIKKISLVRHLSSFHLTHHKTELMAKYNFNITFPIFDQLLRTVYRDTAESSVLVGGGGRRRHV